MIVGLSLGIGSLSGLFFHVPVNIPEFFFFLLALTFVSAIGGYLLIPTHIYSSFSPIKIYSKELWIYYAFIFFTLGIGPAVMYFIRWKAMIESKMKINGGPGL